MQSPKWDFIEFLEEKDLAQTKQTDFAFVGSLWLADCCWTSPSGIKTLEDFSFWFSMACSVFFMIGLEIVQTLFDFAFVGLLWLADCCWTSPSGIKTLEDFSFWFSMACSVFFIAEFCSDEFIWDSCRTLWVFLFWFSTFFFLDSAGTTFDVIDIETFQILFDDIADLNYQ